MNQELASRNRSLSIYVIFLGFLAAFGQPLSGLLYDSRLVFLSIYGLRESWLIFGFTILVLATAKSVRNRVRYVKDLFPIVVYVTSIAFALLVLLSEKTPSAMIVFLQFRNLFGFVLLTFVIAHWGTRLDQQLMIRALVAVSVLVLVYSALELFFLFSSGQLISNEIFNKELLEQAKGTRADVGGGLFGGLRVPGSLFNPSQLGMFCVYLIYAGTAGRRCLGNLLIVGLLSLVVIGFSKSAIVMACMLALLRLFGRQFALLALLCFLFSPLILEIFESVLSSYHYASIARHFDGYTSALRLLGTSPFGSGIGSAGELASTLGGFEATAGFESGLGTLITNLGVFGLVLYFALGVHCYRSESAIYFELFALWSVSMFFNEAAMSPHLFVFQALVAASIAGSSKFSTRHESSESSRAGHYTRAGLGMSDS